MAQTILYYPTINIQDGTWLRNAILYWDEVSSIVPYKGYEDFSPELSYLKNLGVYSPIYPHDLFASGYANDFYHSVIKRIEGYERSIAKKHNEAQNDQVRSYKSKIPAPALYELIHYRKLPWNIMKLFGERRFVTGNNTDEWVEIDSKIAHIYMRTLAEYSIKCANKDIVLGTDTSAHSREIYGRIRNQPSLQTQCCQISLEKCLPQPSMDVSYEDILDFKARRRDELREFRSKIRELETNLYNADSPELIKHYEAQFVESWEQCAKDFYRVLKESRITFFLNSFVSLVALPFVGQLLTPYLGQDLTSAIQTGAPLLNIGIGYFNYKEKISPAKTDGGFSYIIKANSDGIIHF